MSEYLRNLPGCRVRDFEVVDIFPFGIVFDWEKDGEATFTVLFERNCPIPSAKVLTFHRYDLAPHTYKILLYSILRQHADTLLHSCALSCHRPLSLQRQGCAPVACPTVMLTGAQRAAAGTNTSAAWQLMLMQASFRTLFMPAFP